MKTHYYHHHTQNTLNKERRFFSSKKKKNNVQGLLTAAMKVALEVLSNRMKANFPLRSLTTWSAG